MWQAVGIELSRAVRVLQKEKKKGEKKEIRDIFRMLGRKERKKKMKTGDLKNREGE